MTISNVGVAVATGAAVGGGGSAATASPTGTHQPATTVISGARLASVNGKRYERLINDICAKMVSPHLQRERLPLSTMRAESLGGCFSSRTDLQLNWRRPSDVNIEVKVHTAPDWMQASLAPCCASVSGWTVKNPDRNPALDDLFRTATAKGATEAAISLFPGGTPPFLLLGGGWGSKLVTRPQWDEVRAGFGDVYFDIADDAIAKAYASKGVQYIQISRYGLYHCVEDVCGFGTIPFLCEQRLRVRCKRHGKKCPETGKHVPSTVTASLRPNLRKLPRSPVSLERPVDLACFL